MYCWHPTWRLFGFCLKPHLNRAGISFKKSGASTLIDHPEVLLWLSNLRLHLGLISFPDLETRVFSKPLSRDFLTFYRLFSKVPDRSLSGRYLNKARIRNREGRVTGEEFTKWALFFWPKKGRTELLDQALGSFNGLPLAQKLRYESWLGILESGLFSLGSLGSEEPTCGISCLSLNALSAVKESHVFIMGLDQESLSSLSVAGSEDMEVLSADLGFPLPLSHPRQAELNLLYFLQSSHLKEVVLSFSEWDFSGMSRTASLLWRFFESHSDENQESSQKPVSVNPPLGKFSEADSKTEGASFTPFFQKNRSHFSPHSLNKYVACPFAYAVEYVFRLKSAPQTDREIAPPDAGKITHDSPESVI